MSNVIRVALPGYNVLSDTNLDHFSLYSDQDNILIKEFARGALAIPGNTAPVTIAHNLGYVPLFFAYVFDNQGFFNVNEWKLVCHNSAGASVPLYMATADATNLYLWNYSSVGTNWKYYIFYDVYVPGSTPSFSPTGKVIAVTQSGHNVLTDTNPNDFIFHSQLNTFKILKEGNTTINFTGTGIYTFAHGLALANPASYMIYIKFPDGYTGVLPGKGVMYSYNSAYYVNDAYIDTTNFGMNINGSTNTTLYVKYYIFETPLS